MTSNHRDVFARACERAAAYRDSVPERPLRPRASAEDLRARLGGPTPQTGADWTDVIDQLADAAEPGLMTMASPRFFGFVLGASHPVGVAADWLAAAWGQNAGLFQPAPASAVTEEVAGGWVLDMLGLPSGCSVGFVTGATMANFVCLAAARDEALLKAGWDIEEHGLQGAPRIRVCLGADAHTTVFKALRYLGIGAANITTIPADADGRMDADALETALADAGGPTIVAAQAGQINTGAFDPFTRIPAMCRAAGAWLHVDGAFGLWAKACPDRAHLAAGVEDADSWSTDAHKWLQAPFDSGLAIVRDPAAHRRAMAIGASYLPDDAANFDPSHHTPELSRRARGYAVWALLKALGREGVAEMVSRHCACARHVAQRLAAEPGVRVMNEVDLNQVAVLFGADLPADRQDALARELIARVQGANRVYVGGAAWRDRWIVRISVISDRTGIADMDVLAGELITAWREVRASAPAGA
ncbi:MAG: aminotransferase class V-fold PLP-dependent enzyme [Caulobacterales bacterium]|nr:aminotransferase class V-fold PLP-dependent enzyme [Caulobacterales bacterium]